MKWGLWTLFVVWAAVSADPTKTKTTTKLPPTGPTNVTTRPTNVTTGPTNTTTKLPSTTGPTNTTTKLPSTTGPTNTTTAPTNATTAPTNATTAPTNATTSPTNVTTAPTNATTSPTTATTVPTNATTAPTNATTVPTNVTTTLPWTTRHTPMPTAVTNLTTGDYSLKAKDKTCVHAVVALQIRLQSAKANGTFIVQPVMTTPHGDCQNTTANLTLNFLEGAITFLYNKNTTENRFYVNALSFNLSYPIIPGGSNYRASNESLNLFSARIGHSYSCQNDSIHMGNGLYLDISQNKMQAFTFSNNQDFDSPDVCPADKPDYSVAIGVGITLLVLIIIVVVVYLLGRRKRANGYQSL